MQVIVQAWKDLQDRLLLVFAYVGAHSLLFLTVGLLEWAVGFEPDGEVVPPGIAALKMLDQIALAAAIAAVQAIVFARIGKDIDRPLWKCSDDLDALRRFFLPWLLLNLGYTAIAEVGSLAIRNDLGALFQLTEMLRLFYMLLYLPIGACIMYWGRLDWNELGETLRPIVRQFALVLNVFLLQLAQHFVNLELSIVLQGKDPATLSYVLFFALGAMPITLLELLAFVAMWHVLMINRNAPEDEDEDFDF